jgi:hypothetical protein
MKPFSGWAITAGLIFAATAANAQSAPQQAGAAQYQPVSDFSEPYADVPPRPMPPQAVMPEYGPGMVPSLLPPTEVYTVLRENGFSPLGVPRLRGLFYSIAAIDRRGNDGRLVIDARNGQIVRFLPAYRDSFYEGPPVPYAPMSPLSRYDGPPRPPAAVPKVASRMPLTVPVPKAAPGRSVNERPLAEKPALAPVPNQQSAAVQAKPADTPQASPPAPDVAKPPVPAIQPTQPMPKMQGLE